MNKFLFLALAIVFFHPKNIIAQQSYSRVSGTVLSIGENQPLSNVIVSVLGSLENTATDSKGRFVLNVSGKLPAIIVFSRIGLVEQRLTIEKQLSNLTVTMAEEPLEVGYTTISAKSEYVGKELGSKTIITKKLIEHIQPSSLTDLLQFLPGNRFSNQSLSSPGQFQMRQVETSSDALRVGASGTSIIMDGVPLSNDANLQSDVTILNSSPGTLPPFSSVSGRGYDLRTLPTENIESVEIVRGIPSVKYGELTAGAVLVQSRIGQFAPQFSFRNGQLIQEFNAAYGLKLSDGIIATTDLNYAHAKEDLRYTENSVNRYVLGFALRNNWIPSELETQFKFQFQAINDDDLQSPDDLRYQRENWTRDKFYRFSLQTFYRPYSQLIDEIELTSSYSIGDQNSYYQSNVSRDIFPVTNATTDTTLSVGYGASSYLNKTTVSGSPINGYIRFELNKKINSGDFQLRLSAGSELKTDGNTGEGRQFDPTKPPLQNYSVGDRPRSFSEIPFITKFAGYFESKLTSNIFSLPFILQLGLRYDNIQPVSLSEGKFGEALSPRLNVVLQPTTNIWVHFGYGESVKSPALTYLYPGNRYFDLVNFNYYADNPKERLAIVTTRVIREDNSELKESRSIKREVGMEFHFPFGKMQLSAFNENTFGGYGYNRLLKVYPVVKYKVAQTKIDEPPIIDPVPASIDTFFAAYDTPVNSREIHNYGFEFVIDSDEIKPISTTLSFSGALTKTFSKDNSLSYDTDVIFRSTLNPSRVGVYKSGAGSKGERLLSALRIVHRSEFLKLLFSLHIQTIWWEKDQPFGYDAFPIGFMDRKGKVTFLSEQERYDNQYSDLRRIYDSKSFDELYRKQVLWLTNIRITKEITSEVTLSLYVNNLFNNRPLLKNDRTNSFERRNIPMVFGAELNYRL